MKMQSSGIHANIQQVPCISCPAFPDCSARHVATRANFSCVRSPEPVNGLGWSALQSSQFNTDHLKCRQTANFRRMTYIQPKAVVTTESRNTEATTDFKLDGGSTLKVNAVGAGNGSPAFMEFKVLNSGSSSLLLHWGAVKAGQSDWTIPSQFPEGTRNYKKRALQTPFVKSGDISSLKLEIPDASFTAIEFLLKDEANGKWYKLNGGNFRVDIPTSGFKSAAEIAIPDELVSVQAYIQWEKSGKQNYSPEKEKAEYERARRELQEEVARGVSIDVLKSRLLGGKESSDDAQVKTEAFNNASEIVIPEELVSVQAYVQWEKGGKQNYSPEKEKAEYERARRELQEEVARGVSIDVLKSRLLGGKESSGGTQVKTKAKTEQGIPKRITRKARDISEIIAEGYQPSKGTKKQAASVRELTPLEQAAEKMECPEGASIARKTFKFWDKELLVTACNLDGDVRVTLATNFQNSLVLHWALSKERSEWNAPPDNIIPSGSFLGEGACETPFITGFAGDSSLQYVDITLGKTGFIGMPFVLKSGGDWIKNNGSDFFVSWKPSSKERAKEKSDGSGTAKWLLDEIANEESEAERSLMHRYNIATGLAERAKTEGELALAGILVWLRFMASRQLTWNKNYNVKPREISAAQERLTGLLTETYKEQPENREIIRFIMSTVGRGAAGDVGQRIRDEILVVQRNNDCKGGMMEEWHQKLHNNTSPDDIVICQALLDYIQNGFNMDVYWKTLNKNGVTKERLASYDRPIVSEPRLRPDQKDGLIRDLTAYMKTLKEKYYMACCIRGVAKSRGKAVHSGADLDSAIAACIGYSAKGFDFMGDVHIQPVNGLSPIVPELLRFTLEHIEDKDVIPLLEAILEARRELWPTLQQRNDRLRDIIFLDLALDGTVRTAVERSLDGLKNAVPKDIIAMITLVLENLCLSSNNNEELVYCLKDFYYIQSLSNGGVDQWALQAKAVLDRTRLVLTDKAEYYQKILQPSAEYLGSLLGVERWAIDIFTEEMIRAGSAATLSQLLNRLDPILRSAANLGSWQVISPVEVQGIIKVVHELGDVQDKVYEKPTVLVASRVKGEEEIPSGAVAVLTPDMPDVLSHVSVRARNGKICFATCFDPDILNDLKSKDGRAVKITLGNSSELKFSEVSEVELSNDAAASEDDPPQIVLKSKKFLGRYAIGADEFSSELVGAKSLNIANLRGKLPSWIKIPTSVALPFGVFEKVLADDINTDVAAEINSLKAVLDRGEFEKLPAIRAAVLKMQCPKVLIEELKTTMLKSDMPWPGNESEDRWQQAWMSIKRVWASKWNERAYFSTRKARIDHDLLRMAVLVQEIICADYAFVIHTTNPSNGDTSEIYAEIVKGLGETLVGAYSGRALSFVAHKSDLDKPKVLGYPSKRIGLFINPSVIFRSDSNGEDLEGYAGAGLYDSVPMDVEEKRNVDYSTDKLTTDKSFQQTVLSQIAKAGAEVEKLYGTAQDIEGVIKNGELYIVQTRPQM